MLKLLLKTVVASLKETRYHCTHLLRKDYALFLFEIKYFLQVSFFFVKNQCLRRSLQSLPIFQFNGLRGIIILQNRIA